MDANLVLLKKDGSRKGFDLTHEVTIVGRGQDCDLCIPVMVVSRKHCELSQKSNILKLRDLGSTNGTYVNGKKVEQTELNPGDCIQIGPVVFGIQVDGQPEDIKIPESAILEPRQPAKSAAEGEGNEFPGGDQFEPFEKPDATELFEDINDDTEL